MSFLIDPNGIIIAKNLRGMALHQELDKHVKSLCKLPRSSVKPLAAMRGLFHLK
jgi:hypothetical protein